MNVLYLTMAAKEMLVQPSVHHDLLQKFVKEGHKVYVISPSERRLNEKTSIYDEDGLKFLRVKTLNLQKTSVLEKGIGQVLVEGQFKRAIKKFWHEEKFDLILYTTPPITLTGAINFLKQYNPEAQSYLLLKDIFPQNAVDINMMGTKGMKGILYRYFREKEKELYAVSDYIGCMSPANVRYLITHNPEIPTEKVEVAPNSIELIDNNNLGEKRLEIRKKYGIPVDKPVFIYGGNLGKPQGISFLIECLRANATREDCFFVVVGSGTELPKLQEWYDESKPRSIKVMNGLPKSEYDVLVGSCDAGLIFLDHRFTIPNYPSRLLSYLEYKMPVLCATDPNTDMGSIAEANGYGYWCESVNPENFTAIVDKMLKSDMREMGDKGYQFLKENYLVENTYNAIMSHV